jgi:hypothetical protein
VTTLQERLARLPAARRRQVDERLASLVDAAAGKKERYYSIKELMVLWGLPRKTVKKLVLGQGDVIPKGGVITICTNRRRHFAYMVPEWLVERIRPRAS